MGQDKNRKNNLGKIQIDRHQISLSFAFTETFHLNSLTGNVELDFYWEKSKTTRSHRIAPGPLQTKNRTKCFHHKTVRGSLLGIALRYSFYLFTETDRRIPYYLGEPYFNFYLRLMNNDMMHATRLTRQRRKLTNSEINTKNLNVRFSMRHK